MTSAKRIDHTRPNIPLLRIQNREFRDVLQPTYYKRLDETFIRFRSTARKVLDIRAIPQQPMRCGRQDECPDLLKIPSLFLQGGRKGLGSAALRHRDDLECVEVW